MRRRLGDDELRRYADDVMLACVQIGEGDVLSVEGCVDDRELVTRLAEISAPTLVVVGDLDQPDILTLADRLAADIPGARRVVVPGTAHVPNLKRPDQVSELFLEFLDSQSERVIA